MEVRRPGNEHERPLRHQCMSPDCEKMFRVTPDNFAVVTYKDRPDIAYIAFNCPHCECYGEQWVQTAEGLTNHPDIDHIEHDTVEPETLAQWLEAHPQPDLPVYGETLERKIKNHTEFVVWLIENDRL